MYVGDKVDWLYKDYSYGICLYEIKSIELLGYKCMKFDMNLIVYEIFYEDCVSEWMIVSFDCYWFERWI